jgi:hypothetical protein
VVTLDAAGRNKGSPGDLTITNAWFSVDGAFLATTDSEGMVSVSTASLAPRRRATFKKVRTGTLRSSRIGSTTS